MKRRRNMLLCVTATSMAAAVGCTPAQPVGIVGRPDYTELEAGSPDAVEASAPVATEATPAPDAGWVGKVAVGHDGGALPDLHPDRVGTTATVDDRQSPRVGTTARVPDKTKTK